ncbi:hypothetical protein E0L36_09840 [Streptomyces sp. AJS327]|uniref:hypothetical protein n=1 Tax=Streptomyces sp. AJS327 TaxID=2545265 RepID=UPI0015DF32D0|nr:hypothetical protein [Streptomyces sp. AJS327]MBA0051183.1 hypothetical protein [Streptomyces sp. AJS327]
MKPSHPLALVPVPEAVTLFKSRQLPPRVRNAVLATANAKRAFQLCRTPYTWQAREYAIADIYAGRKVLATVPSRRPLDS